MSRSRERPAAGDKRKQPAEEVAPENRRATEPSGLIAASRAMTREEEGRQRRRRETIDSSEQRASGGDVAVDADVAIAIRQLPSHLQLMVTFLAEIVSPSEEGKLKEKRGKDAIEQATSMMMVVSIVSSFDKFFF